jgi:enoyl-CoA hydratase/carnithine racemase
LFSARLVEADEALRLGPINLVVTGDEAEAKVRGYAQTIAANAPCRIVLRLPFVLASTGERTCGRSCTSTRPVQARRYDAHFVECLE